MAVVDKKVVKKVVTKHSVSSSFNSEDDWISVNSFITNKLLEDFSSFALLITTSTGPSNEYSIASPIGVHQRTCKARPHRTKRRKVTVTTDAASIESDEVRAIREALAIGLNACTRALESDPQEDGLVVLLICTKDATSHLLHDHFPALCDAYGQRGGGLVYLIPMPVGTEAILGKALGLPRVGCLGLKDRPVTHEIIKFVRENVQLPEAKEARPQIYKPLQIKTTISTATTQPNSKK